MRAVLAFHGVDASGGVLSIAPEELRRLLAGIRASGHRIVPLRELLEQPAEDGRVALSFDDGFASLASAALPVLREAGATATLFLTTGHVGGDNRWRGQPAWAPVFPMLDWDGVAALAGAGWAIEAHSVSHPDLRALPDAGIDRELEACADTLEARLGRRPDLFAYPYGYLDDRVVARVRGRFRFALTTELAPLGPRLADPLRVPRLDGYYLRSAAAARHFGSAGFRAWLGGRALLRRVRGAVQALR